MPSPRRFQIRHLAWLLVACFGIASAGAADDVSPDALTRVFPSATHLGASSGSPPAAPAFRGQERIGYVFSTAAVAGSTGFAGRPIDILVGLDNDGRVTGAWLREHSEPILVIGIPEERLDRYVRSFAGIDLRTRVRPVKSSRESSDAISGATISSVIIGDAIIRSARAVAESRGILTGPSATARLDRPASAPATWAELLADGSLARRRLGRDDAGRIAADEAGNLYIDLHAGLLTPPRIGESLLGKITYNRLYAALGPDDHAIIIAANGLHSFKGTSHVRSGVFERIQVIQATRTIPLLTDGYRNIERLTPPDAPEFREIGVFVLPAATGFDPMQPWRLSLLVDDAAGRPAAFELGYDLPGRYRIEVRPPVVVASMSADDTPLWRQIWRERLGLVSILASLLVALTAVLVLQDWIVRDVYRYRTIRLGFLAVTLIWLGWYAGGQLSVIHVLTFVHSLLHEFKWEFFLVDPLIFILWSYVAVTLLFWGRGVFCGWLCPFGALQELLSEAARAAKLPQVRVPFVVHERLWPIKYIAFIGLFAVSLHSTAYAVLGAEIEPFKTAVILKFDRAWPFVAYAGGLLAAGLFIERFFCRYLCPLGAALAIPARLRMFAWLKRRHQCGRECQICAQRCTVQALHPTGEINLNECVYCLSCQTIYYDDRTCPPLAAQRKRRETRLALNAAADRQAGGGLP